MIHNIINRRGINLDNNIDLDSSNHKPEKKINWTEKDWKWLVGILIAIIIFIFTFRLGDNQDVTDLFSFISSSVSIALAGVAIFLALKQDTDNRRVNEQTSQLLREMNFGIRNVDEGLKRIDERDIKSLTKSAVEDITDEQEKESYSKDEVKQMLNDLSNNVVTEINNQLNTKKERIIPITISRNADISTSIGPVVRDIIKSNPSLDNNTIKKLVEESSGYLVSTHLIRQIKESLKS